MYSALLTSVKESDTISGVESTKITRTAKAEEAKAGKQFLAQNSAVVIQPLYANMQSCATTDSITTIRSNSESSITSTFDLSKISRREVISKMNGVATTIKSMLNTNDLPPAVSVPREVDHVAGQSLLSYECDVCGRVCSNKHKLNRHLLSHSKGKPFLCPVCGRSYKWFDSLQRHIRQHHGKNTKVNKQQSGEFSLFVKTYIYQYSEICIVCMYLIIIPICLFDSCLSGNYSLMIGPKGLKFSVFDWVTLGWL